MPEKSKSPRKSPKTYAKAGVSIAAGDALVDYLKKSLPGVGGFSSLAALPPGMKSPRLLMATDGVGTKLLVAQLAGIHNTIGIDLVAMVVNDLICTGGRPLYFLDYFATGKLDPGVAKAVLRGIMKGCVQAGCALVGGETAEMPGMYARGHYDLAGFGVGVVEQRRAIDGSKVASGDIVLGLASTGLHSNGYSLARDALLPKTPASAKRALARPFAGTKTSMAKALLKPTQIYVRTVVDLVGRFPIHAMANVTGGGIEGNLVRVIPNGLRACVQKGTWRVPKIFEEIARKGPVDEAEMFKTFNMGIGYIIVAPPASAERIMRRCKELRQPCQPIGWIAKGTNKKAEPEVAMLER